MTGSSDLRLTYIGGPTLLIEFAGLRFLTDPTFDPPGSYTTGPVTLTKITGPALDASELGHIDAVLLSHDHHFDNLDHSGRELLRSAATVITTAEGESRLKGNAIGLEPWQAVQLRALSDETITVTATPAQHGPPVGERGPVIGFILTRSSDPENAIYICGDTVWFEGVEKVLERFPNIRLAVLFMGAAHVPVLPTNITLSADEGVRIARSLPNATIVPVHYEGWKHFTEARPQIAQTFAAAGLEPRLLWLSPAKPTAL